jgi:hypothetical protein
MIFIDTSAFHAIYVKNDKNHCSASLIGLAMLDSSDQRRFLLKGFLNFRSFGKSKFFNFKKIFESIN